MTATLRRLRAMLVGDHRVVCQVCAAPAAQLMTTAAGTFAWCVTHAPKPLDGGAFRPTFVNPPRSRR